MSPLRFGIVGTGFIAGAFARALNDTDAGTLVAVASRDPRRAEQFAQRHGADRGWGTYEALFDSGGVDAVFVATPTLTKIGLAERALAAGLHVLIDKPFPNADELGPLIEQARTRQRVLMDGTHFVHHARTALVQNGMSEKLGTPRSCNTTFYVPFSSRDNIRYSPALEPTGAWGDTGWYAMRAIVEFLDRAPVIEHLAAVGDFDAETGACTRAAGFLGLASGRTANFDVGYTTGTAVMELQLLGTHGVITMDDFVLDWANSIAFRNPDIAVGFTHRSGMMARDQFNFVSAPTWPPQMTRMIEAFVARCRNVSPDARAGSAEDSLATQRLVDAVWSAISRARR